MSDANNSRETLPPQLGRHRRSVLDLAPLELDCMNTLWPLGEATVRDIRDRLADRRPRAYTTIMTIMDRLARKGVVERRKHGRAYIYRAHLTADEARSQALTQLIDNFFQGSRESLLAQLATAKQKPDSANPLSSALTPQHGSATPKSKSAAPLDASAKTGPAPKSLAASATSDSATQRR